MTGVGAGVDVMSDGGEDLVTEVVDVVFVLSRIRVVLVPWTVVPLRLVSLPFDKYLTGVVVGATAMPRLDASLESP